MTTIGIFQILVFFGIILLLTKPVGLYMARVFQGERTFLHPLLRPVEVLVYRVCGVRENEEHGWLRYTASLLAFSLFAFLFPYTLMRLQGLLPLNPQGFGAAQVSPDQAFNTAVSFMTNTNWQWYSGEAAMSYLVQMAALAVQNFVSAAAGAAVAVALIRGFARHDTDTIGNFWVDHTRATLYILLPLCLAGALLLASQGVVQNFSPYTAVTTLEGATQTIAQGPAASQVSVKMIGTNGGGFFNANSAHPFESPTGFTNLVHLLMIFVLGAGFTYAFGHMVQDTRQGWALFWAMAVMFFIGVFVAYPFEQAGNPIMAKLGIESAPTDAQPGGNMEGKETRFGIAASALFATVTTDASSGAVNSMHDSYTPIGGLVPLFNMQTDEVIFGGVGAGLYSMLLYAILGVFIAGLMVGRTPGIHRQEDPAERSHDGAPRHPGDRSSDSDRRRGDGPYAVLTGQLLEPRRSRDRQPEQRRSPWPQRGALRLHERVGEQRQRVRRHHRQHPVVRPHARPLHAPGPFPVHHPRAGDRREPGEQEGRPDVIAGRCRRTGRFSSACSSPRSSLSAR